jgi:hypothetical protein
MTTAFAGDCISASTSIGNATDETADPRAETTCPLHSSMKSRLWRSGSLIARLPAPRGQMVATVTWLAPPVKRIS